MQPSGIPTPEFIGAGRGPLVVLIHSSVSGARQWRRLIGDLEPRHECRAVNLYGYGGTPPWPGARPQSLADQAMLVERIIPDDARDIAIVGHSFGATVAMKLAARLGERVGRLVVFEPNLSYLLREHGRTQAFAQARAMEDWIRRHGAAGDWTTAAERFSEYWAGAGSWAAMPAERREAFTQALKPNYHEWDCVMDETTTLPQWEAALPRRTLVVGARETVRLIADGLDLLRAQCPHWSFDGRGRWPHGAADAAGIVQPAGDRFSPPALSAKEKRESLRPPL